MNTLSVAGETADTPANQAILPPAGQQPDVVVAFCERKGLIEYLQKAVELAEEAFAPTERLDAEVRRSPETDEEWIVLRVVVRADRVNVSAARKAYTTAWVAAVPESQRFLIRLSPDIL